jgi:hypothetical protein
MICAKAWAGAPFALVIAMAVVSDTDSFAQTIETLVIGGKPVTIEEQSIKCDVDPADIPDNISTKRLANCDSAEIVTVDYNGEEIGAIKFTISPDDKKISSGVRAELRDLHVAQNDDETWYRFATLVPEDFPIDAKHRLVLAQWHERMQEGQDSLRPPISHRMWDGRFVVTLWNKQRVADIGKKGDGAILYELPSLKRGVFHDYVYKVVWTPEDKGRIVAWHRQCPVLDTGDCDGGTWSEIINYEGSTGYDNTSVSGYYFKLGLYTVTDFDVPFTAYHRGYRSGASAAEIGATDPVFQ